MVRDRRSVNAAALPRAEAGSFPAGRPLSLTISREARMDGYRFAVGTHDPHAIAATSDAEAVRAAVALVAERYGADLAGNPQEVATLIGPAGLVTRPAERIDEFVARLAGEPGTTVQPGDSNSPDCNGD